MAFPVCVCETDKWTDGHTDNTSFSESFDSELHVAQHTDILE